MDKKHKELKKHIKRANNILIISHRGPDPDAFCSMLLLKEAIKQVYPNKKVVVKAKQMPNFNIPTMKDIQVVEKLEKGDEELILITDMGDINVCIEEGDSLRESSSPIVMIDHHSTVIDNGILTINERRSSATEQVYITVKRIFGKKLHITNDMAYMAQYGILSDTKRFLYSITTTETFRIFAELRDISPVDIEAFGYNSEKFPEESLPVVVEFLKNIKTEGDMAYTYVDRDFSNDKVAMNEAFRFVKDNILRYIHGVHWGFLIKPLEEENTWRISFRSTAGYQKIKDMAEKLGGGGHELAAGGEVTAGNAEEAVEKVLGVARELKD